MTVVRSDLVYTLSATAIICEASLNWEMSARHSSRRAGKSLKEKLRVPGYLYVILSHSVDMAKKNP